MSLPSSFPPPGEPGCLKYFSFSPHPPASLLLSDGFIPFLNSEHRKWDCGVCCCLFFFFPLPIFVVGFLSNLMSPSQGAFFIYLLEMERMGGRALYSSMLCFMMRLHSKAFNAIWAGKLLHLCCAQLYFLLPLILLCLLFSSPPPPASFLLASFYLSFPLSDYPSRFS